MGCGSSAADRAIGLDGPENVETYITEKNKQIFIENYIQEIYKDITHNVKRLKQSKLNEINYHQNNAIKNVQNMKAQLQTMQPNSIAKAAALNKTSPEQFLGLNQTLLNLQQQKTIVNLRYQNEQQKIIKQIKQEYEKIHQAINPSIEKLINVSALPQSDRIKAFKWGSQYAYKKIKIQVNMLKQQMDKKFNFSNFQKRFEGIVPSKNLQAIVEQGRYNAAKTSGYSKGCISC